MATITAEGRSSPLEGSQQRRTDDGGDLRPSLITPDRARCDQQLIIPWPLVHLYLVEGRAPMPPLPPKDRRP